MTNIKLENATNAKDEEQTTETKLFSKGFIWMFIILILTLILYAVLLFARGYLDKQIASVQGQYKDINNSLVGNDTSRGVVDFQNRTKLARKLFNDKQDVKEDLEFLEQTIIPDVTVKSFDFDGEAKMVTIVCVADNYRSVATQILSFKDSDLFASVSGGQSSYASDDSGKIEFPVELKLK